MDSHPIPQDITGFEFKLIGEMTVKQFAYLATGTILGWLAFSLPVSFLIKFPFMAIFIIFGVSFAFFSIEGRPVDTMIINFLKAAFSPTQFVYQPTGSQISNVKSQIAKTNVQTPGEPNIIQAKHEDNKLDKREFDFFHMLSQMLTPAPSQTVQASSDKGKPYIITSEVPGEKKKEEHPPVFEETPAPKIEVLVAQSQNLERKLQEAKEEEKKDEGLPSYEGAHQKVLELENLLSQTQSQKQQLEQEIMNLRRQLETKRAFTPSIATAPKETKNVRVIPKELGKSAGIPIAPEFPNVISGIIKDPRGNPLPNILVEVKDKEGNPARAFKTNALGQFSASTALSNGSYTIDFEDPNSSSRFDSVAFNANGNIILPIEVISIDTREELRKSLFTN